MSQNKSVEEVVEEINQCIRVNSNASICTNCAGGGYDYEDSQDCKKCNASGITNWDFDYLNKRLTELIQQERQTSQEREREIVEAVKDALPIQQDEECPDDYDCPYCKRGLSNKCDTMDVPRVINEIRNDVLGALERLTNPNKD